MKQIMTPELNASLNALILEVGADIASDVRAMAEAAIREAFERGAATERAEWKPIETAPKDGTHVVLFGTLWNDPNQTVRACVSWYCRNRDEGPAFCAGWFFSSPGYTDGFNPTHWMPLPSPHGQSVGLRGAIEGDK